MRTNRVLIENNRKHLNVTGILTDKQDSNGNVKLQFSQVSPNSSESFSCPLSRPST